MTQEANDYEGGVAMECLQVALEVMVGYLALAGIMSDKTSLSVRQMGRLKNI